MELPYQYRSPVLGAKGGKRRRGSFSLLAAAMVVSILWGLPVSAQPHMVDRVAAVVGEDPITWTEVIWFIRYRNLPIPETGDARREFLGGILDQLINQYLVVKESAKTPFVQVSEKELEEYLAGYRQTLGGEQQLQKRLEELGFGLDQLREIMRRRIVLNKFTQVRFEPFVIVLPDEIQAYYEETLTSELRDQGQDPPPLPLVEETIRQILTVEKTTSQLEAWIRNVRSRYDTRVLLFGSPSPNLPAELIDDTVIDEPPFSETPSASPESESPDHH